MLFNNNDFIGLTESVATQGSKLTTTTNNNTTLGLKRKKFISRFKTPPKCIGHTNGES